MSPQTEFLNLLIDTIEENCNLGSKISLKELPKGGGLYAEAGEGFAEATYYNKTRVIVLPVLFLCRDADLQDCAEQLYSICNYLQGLTAYPQGENVSWLDTEVAKEPSRIGRDEDGVYHYSCILNCKIYF